MAKKQSRRSVSMNRGVYDDLKVYSERTGKSMSSIVDKQVRVFLNNAEELDAGETEETETPSPTDDTDPEN